MSGVLNTTARPYVCKAQNPKSGFRTKVVLNPGLNEVEDSHWKEVKASAFVKGLVSKGIVKHGTEIDDQLLDKSPDTKSLSKSEPVKANTK